MILEIAIGTAIGVLAAQTIFFGGRYIYLHFEQKKQREQLQDILDDFVRQTNESTEETKLH